MKKTMISLATLGLIAFQGLAWADVAANAEACMDCHEASDFEGMDAAALLAAAKEANAHEKMMAKATKELSEEDWKAVAEHLAGGGE